MNREMREFYENMPAEGGVCTMGSTVDAFNEMGPQVAVHDYARRMYETDPMVQATWGQVNPEREFKDFDDLNNFLKENMPKEAVYEDRPAVIEGSCIDERLSPLDML